MQPYTSYTALFLTLGLGSTLMSRMVLNLKGWGRVSQARSLQSKHIVGGEHSRGVSYINTRRVLATGSEDGRPVGLKGVVDAIEISIDHSTAIDGRESDDDEKMEMSTLGERDNGQRSGRGSIDPEQGVMVRKEVVTRVDGSSLQGYTSF